MAWVPLGALIVGVSLLVGWALRRRQSPPPFRVKAARRGGDRYDVALPASRLECSEAELTAFEPRYHEFEIGKRGKTRKIQAPDDETKALQRKILDRVLARLRVHPAVKGFEPGTSVVANAAAHAHKEVVIKLDLVDFFPSTKASRIHDYFRFVGWTKDAAALLTRLTTHDGALPQGAPTSPALSNRVNYGLDEIISRRFSSWGAVYTRYADDLTISLRSDSARVARGAVELVRRTARRFGYRVHTGKKHRILRRHHSQRVTGLVVNEGVRVPRETRRWLRAVEHRMKTGKPATLSAAELAGWKAYVAHVDSQRPTPEQQRQRLQEALAATRYSLTAGAEHFGTSKPIFVRLLKEHGLWDPRPNRNVPERNWG